MSWMYCESWGWFDQVSGFRFCGEAIPLDLRPWQEATNNPSNPSNPWQKENNPSNPWPEKEP